MDFLSRDRQRRAVEELAAPSGDAQVRVALKAVENARQAAAKGSSADRAAHVGYHLIDRGLRDLEADVAYRPRLASRARRLILGHATFLYFAMITVTSAALLAPCVALGRLQGLSAGELTALTALLLFPVSDVAIAIAQRVTARVVPPRRLPRLDYSGQVPDHARTMVVVPTMLTSVPAVDALLEHIEVLALGNLDPHIHFAILSDFADADASELAGDAPILAAARAGIEQLNQRFGPEHANRFFLFHRARQWNIRERAWMGWERKRGKIEEFNRLLRGAADTSFIAQVGALDVLPAVRYCITLDTDTRLPRDSAKELIGIISHPLNRPSFDARAGRVTEGYGILQPRVSVTMASAAGSLFARAYAGHTGVDPYTTAVSDVYQDLFDEGIFTGKGLYDVDAFVAALEGRVPENALLSHDLFEGLYARTALVTDVEVVDDYPSSVLTHARRQHRWVRGDWQILWWLFPFVPTRTGLQRNRLPLVSRWKILDNLRRSLMAPATVALLLLGWTVLPGSPLAWTAIALAPIALPVLIRLVQLRSRAGGRGIGGGLHASGARGSRNGRGPLRTAAGVSRQSCLRDAACDHRHARAPRDHEASTARVGNGRGERQPWRNAAPQRVRQGDDREPAVGIRLPRAGRPDPPAGAAGVGPGARTVDGGAAHRLRAQPPGAESSSGARRRGSRVSPIGRAKDVGVLRHVRPARGSRPAAGQRPARTDTDRRAPHLAHQHRDGTARHAGGARPRLHRRGCVRRAN